MSISGDKNPFFGRVHSEETKQKLRDKAVTKVGVKSPRWKGGITPVYTRLRHSFEYEGWRKAVFERDDYTCQLCNSVGEYLHADHIKGFSEYPDLRFEISNGRTLCVECHYEVTWGKKMPEGSKWGTKRSVHKEVV